MSSWLGGLGLVCDFGKMCQVKGDGLDKCVSGSYDLVGIKSVPGRPKRDFRPFFCARKVGRMNHANWLKTPCFVDVMVDIETLGGPPGGVPWSVAMVRFDRETGELDGEFEVSVDPVDAEREGCRIDASTAVFWVGQERSARSKLLSAARDGISLEEAMNEVRTFLLGPDRAKRVWARSPTFDLDILRHAMGCVGVEWPVEFWQERDHRTVFADLPKDVTAEIKALTSDGGTKHVALDDAKHQVRTLVLAERYRKTGRIQELG